MLPREKTAPGYVKGEAAAGVYLGLAPRTIRNLMRRGAPPYHALSARLILFRLRVLDRALDAVRVGGRP